MAQTLVTLLYFSHFNLRKLNSSELYSGSKTKLRGKSTRRFPLILPLPLPLPEALVKIIIS